MAEGEYTAIIVLDWLELILNLDAELSTSQQN
jgi:hypothetical protein